MPYLQEMFDSYDSWREPQTRVFFRETCVMNKITTGSSVRQSVLWSNGGDNQLLKRQRPRNIKSEPGLPDAVAV